jgi:putative ABC transport system permease protein
VLGVEPLHGRVFTWEEAQDSVPPILLGYAPFQRRFGGNPDIVGRNVEINGRMLPVMGVLPEGFVLPVDYGLSSPAEVFYPRYVDLTDPTPMQQGGGSHGDYVTARLEDGETPESALADLERILDPLRADGTFTPERDFHPRLYAVKADIVGTARGTILMLLGAVGLVLLIACGNVANLLLSRSEVRMREVAVRTAMGAGRGRILRQLMTESLVLAGVAGALGFALAFIGVDALLAIDPDAVPRADAVSLDGTVVFFTIAVSLLTALIFGAAPAARVARSGVGTSLHEGGRGGGRGKKSNRMQGFLVALQMAMAVILLTGSGLMMKTFVGLLRIDPGFSAENVLTMRVTAAQGRYPDGDAVAQFYEDMLQRIADVPGVRNASAARQLPLASTMGDAGFRPLGYQPAPNESTQADWQWATPGYFEVMGIPLLDGRTFDARDRRDSQPVVVINQAVARRYWGDESPVGREVLATGGDTAVVVGVVGDLRHNGITNEVKTRYYRVHSQVAAPGYEGWTGSMRSMTLTVQTEGDPWAYLEPIRAEIRAMDPTMPIANLQTVDEVRAASIAQPRFAMVLLAAFSVIALSLAVVGIYGVLAYAVSRRTQEIGIRLALGAGRGEVTGMVVRQGMKMALAGVLIGTGVAWFATGFMATMLYEVTPQDPWTFVFVPLLFAAVALLASWVPAFRASRVRPASALRYE